MRLLVASFLLVALLLCGCVEGVQNQCTERVVSFRNVTQAGCDKISGCLCADGMPTGKCNRCICESVSYKCNAPDDGGLDD